jgi:hypothetical protein
MPSASAPVSCADCSREWNSQTLIDGLRVLGSCPRCGGALRFRADAQDAAERPAPAGAGRQLAPHLVLGLPRR